MSRRRSEWPEPWARLRWAPGDEVRLTRLAAMPLSRTDRDFVDDMRRVETATLQQVAWLRWLARRYKADPDRGRRATARTRHIEVE